MLRLEVAYHDDTREPVAVRCEYRDATYPSSPESYARLAFDHATKQASTTGVVHCGPDGEACRDLLLRERRHWRESCRP